MAKPWRVWSMCGSSTVPKYHTQNGIVCGLKVGIGVGLCAARPLWRLFVRAMLAPNAVSSSTGQTGMLIILFSHSMPRWPTWFPLLEATHQLLNVKSCITRIRQAGLLLVRQCLRRAMLGGAQQEQPARRTPHRRWRMHLLTS